MKRFMEFSFIGMWVLAGMMILYVIFFGYPF